MMEKQLRNEIRPYQENTTGETIEAERKQSHKISWLSKAGKFFLSGKRATKKPYEHRSDGNLRPLGIKVIDKVPWGTHVCQFYQTKEDLIDILVPYFKTGLENNEFCMWITSYPLTAEEAKEALQKEVKNLNDYINNGQIEILDYTEWYMKSGTFNPERVLKLWVDKENQALRRGFDGLRGTGNTFWFDQKEWRDFIDYEASVDRAISNHRMLAICSYALHKCGASELLDVVSNHEYCLSRQNGTWRLTQSAGRIRAEEDLIRKHHDLTERIKELNCLYGISHLVDKDSSLEEILQGTVDLIPSGLQFTEITCARIILKDKTFKTENFKESQWKLAQDIVLHGNRIGSLEVSYLEERPESDEGPFSKEERSLINAVAERVERTIESNQANEHLKHAHSDLNQIFNASIPICVIGKDYTMLRVNETFCTSFGLKREDVLGKKCHEIWQGPFCDTPRCPMRQVISGMEYSEHELIDKNLGDGRKVSCIITAVPYRDINGELIGIVENFTDITERKKAETELNKYRSHLEELVHERTAQLLQEITERKKSEEELRKSEERWRKYFELGLIGIAVTSLEKKWIEVNDHLCQILGYSRQELMKIPWTELTCPENLESDLAQFNRMVIGEVDGVNAETCFIRKDGKIIDAGISTRCLRNQDGTIEYFVVLIQDITERKQAEKALRESEESYKTLVENSRDLIFTVNLKGNFMFTNKSCAAVLGYTPEELRHLNGFELVHPEDLETVTERFKGLIDGKIQNDMEYRYKTKGGYYITILNNAVPLFDSQGNAIAALGIARDITERKRMEEALRQSEAKYRNLMEHASDAIIITDKEGNFLEANKKAKILFGYSRKELVNMNIAQIHPKEDLERPLRAFREAVRRKGEGELINVTVLRKDGTTVPVDIAGKIIYYGGKEVMHGIFRDITERKRIEEELQKIQKLEAIGVLAGGIAHDFNNLLTEIIGNLSLAELYTKPGEDMFDTLQRVKQASKRAGQLTKQLLTFSKGGAPIKETASIPELIEETAVFALRGSNVRCEYVLPDNLWPVEIDKGQISQVIHNLIINAGQAMPDGGIITISAENTAIKGNSSLPLEKGSYVRVSVKDQGAGIHPEHLSKIFNPYFTTKEKGTGLGLATCYSIARKHGGYITVESEVGKGARFDLYLPVSDKETFEVKNIVEEELYPGQGTILFMDDEEEVINTARQMLMRLGYRVKGAKGGSEAVTLYKQARESGEPFEAVMLDLIVPGDMGGEQTIKKLLAIDPDVKALVSSGYSNDPIMAEYKRYGFKGVVAKPYEIKELSRALYEVINGKEVLPNREKTVT
ncbi:MAG: PAS domain S-box protein [bacterium]